MRHHRSSLARLALCVLSLSSFFSFNAAAKIVEDKRWVAATVVNGAGKHVSRQIMVTIFYDDAAPQPYPALILNHGRATTARGHQELGRAQYSEISRWFAERGFIVAVPTRIGYGVTGGEDVESSGACANRNYPPAYAAGAAQTLTVLEYLRGWKEVAKDRAVIMGQSFGGAIAVTVAAMNIAGVQAAINFAGGGGGNPDTHPAKPCSPDRLKQLFSDYGKTARIPALWIYTENDKYFGPKLPRQWFDAFKASGGIGEFVLYAPNGSDGHGLFIHAPDIWKPRVTQFLRANGFPDFK